MNNSIPDNINSAIEVIRLNLQSQSSIERLLLEVECTGCIQRLVDIVNKQVLRNFTFKLQMDHDDDDKCHQLNQHGHDSSKKNQVVFTL